VPEIIYRQVTCS